MTDRRASDGAAKARVPDFAAVEHPRVRAAARLNNRVEPSHPSTRLRERVMRRLKSVPSARRVLAAFSQFSNHFRPRRPLLTAAEHRTARHVRVSTWRELAAAPTAA